MTTARDKQQNGDPLLLISVGGALDIDIEREDNGLATITAARTTTNFTTPSKSTTKFTTLQLEEEEEDDDAFVPKQRPMLLSRFSQSLSDSPLSPITEKDHPLLVWSYCAYNEGEEVEREARNEEENSNDDDKQEEEDIHNNDSTTNNETHEQKLAREQQESEQLARQLMAEEALVSYEMSVQFLRDNANNFSEEDMAALLAAMEDERPLTVFNAHDDGNGEQDDDGEEEVLDSSTELSYDTLLRLGERIGNVKEERWSLKSQEHIDKIPVVIFNSADWAAQEKHTGESSSSSCKCLVCQHPYEDSECLRKLPCNHMFHRDCIDHWLSTKDMCPYCRQSIIIDNNDE